MYRKKLFGLVLLIPIALGSNLVKAEITTSGAAGGQSFHQTSQFRLQCWQEGKKVVDESALQGMTVGPALNGSTISFRRRGEQGASVVLISVDRNLCMTSPN